MATLGYWIAYILQSALIMAFLYLGYKWLMSRTTFYGFNRIVLLAVIAASWMLPALMPYMEYRPENAAQITFGTPYPVEAAAASPVVSPGVHIDWVSVAGWIYIAGVAVALALTLVGAAKMAAVIRGGAVREIDGNKVVVSKKAPGPFSWGKYIVMRPEDCDNDVHMVVGHEVEHQLHRHWADLAFAQVTAIMQWFNPAAWLMIRELKNIHEYEVDEILDSRYSHRYQMMLIKKTVGPSFPTFADSLNHSQLKYRLTMMMKSQSKPMRRVAVLAMPVFAAIAVVALSQPAVANVLNRFAPEQTEAVEHAGKFTNFQEDAQVTAEAEVSSVTDTALSSDAGIDATSSTETESATPVQSAAETAAETADPSSAAISAQSEEPTVAPQQIAEYKGGMQALLSFLSENIRFPQGVALSAPVRVIVQFTIGTDGSVSDAKIMKGATDDALNQEAIRVVNATSGNWMPATNGGNPVASKFVIPISFAASPESK